MKSKTKQPKLKTVAFIFIGILMVGLVIRFLFWIMGADIQGLPRHSLNYTIVGSFLSYIILLLYFRVKKKRWL